MEPLNLYIKKHKQSISGTWEDKSAGSSVEWVIGEGGHTEGRAFWRGLDPEIPGRTNEEQN